MPDFDIGHYSEQITRTRGDRVSKDFFPIAGSNCGIVYIEAGAGNGPAILSKLAEIAALAADYRKYQWVANAEVDMRPKVNVRVVVFNNEPLPIPEP